MFKQCVLWKVQGRSNNKMGHLLCKASCTMKKENQKPFCLLFFPAHKWHTSSLRHEGVSSCATQEFQRAFAAHFPSQMSSWVCHACNSEKQSSTFLRYAAVHIWDCSAPHPTFCRWPTFLYKRISAPPLCACGVALIICDMLMNVELINRNL